MSSNWNYATSTVILLIDNDRKHHAASQELARHFESASKLSDAIRDYVYGLCPIFESNQAASVQGCLATACFQEVNWFEVATHCAEKFREINQSKQGKL